MARNALIVGPPRTGTSLAASIFANAGYHVGPISSPRYRMGDDHNPFGYFEADEVIDRNVALFERVGFHHHNCWTDQGIAPETARQIEDLSVLAEDRRLLKAYEERAPWLWKDPRLCYTLSYWWKLMDPETTRVLLVTRDPEDVYHSFRRKEWRGSSSAERQETIELVERHLQAARNAVEKLDIPHVSVDYHEYKDAISDVTTRLSGAFDLDLSREDVNYHPELDHSDLRGRLSGHLRAQLKRLPRAPVEAVASLIPRRLLALLFPERRHSDPL